MTRIVATLAIILASAFVSFGMAVLSIDESIMRIFAITNILSATLAIGFALSNKARIAYGIALSPVPLTIAGIVAWVLVAQALHGERHWDEEVKTSTGEVIVVKRLQKGEWSAGTHFLRVNEELVEADIPGAGHMQWKTSLSPYLLDKGTNGKWYLVGASSSSGEHEYGLEGTIGGLSGSGYAMYRLEGTTWKRIGATDFPSEFDHPNFLIYPEFLFEEKAEPLSLVSEGRVFVVNPGPQMPNGSLVSLAQKSLVSYPLYSHDGRSTFTLTPENLDKGHRQKCKGDGTPCIEIENGLDESFGRSPIQVEARPN